MSTYLQCFITWIEKQILFVNKVVYRLSEQSERSSFVPLQVVKRSSVVHR